MYKIILIISIFFIFAFSNTGFKSEYPFEYELIYNIMTKDGYLDEIKNNRSLVTKSFKISYDEKKDKVDSIMNKLRDNWYIQRYAHFIGEIGEYYRIPRSDGLMVTIYANDNSDSLLISFYKPFIVKDSNRKLSFIIKSPKLYVYR